MDVRLHHRCMFLNMTDMDLDVQWRKHSSHSIYIYIYIRTSYISLLYLTYNRRDYAVSPVSIMCIYIYVYTRIHMFIQCHTYPYMISVPYLLDPTARIGRWPRAPWWRWFRATPRTLKTPISLLKTRKGPDMLAGFDVWYISTISFRGIHFFCPCPHLLSTRI